MSGYLGFLQGIISTNMVEALTPISHWALDGDLTDEQGVSDGSFTGSPETGLDPIAVDAGTSMASASDAYGTIAHDSAYAVDTFTIAVAAQADTVPASGSRSVVTKVPASGHIGETVIEQRSADTARAYLSDSAGNAVIINTVPFPADVATQFVLRYSPSQGGELLYRTATGAFTSAGSPIMNADLGLSGNTADWHVFAYEAGTAVFDGVVDDIWFFDQFLSDAQLEAILPAPQSITHSHGGGGAADEISIPLLTEWLTSDETTPSATKYVSNQNRGNGSGSTAANAQEVQAALTGASPGQTFIAVCQTPGTIEFWSYPSGLTFPSGSAGNYITLQARQNDGVVISAGQSWAGARSPNTGYWTQSGLSSADISKKIWRSTNSVGGAESMMGFWIEFDRVHQIVGAQSMANLRAAYTSSNSPTGYAGPSVYKDTDGYVYLRFQIPHPDKYSTDDKWSVTTFPGYPEAVSGGKLVYPLTEDPNDYVIHLFSRASSHSGFSPSSMQYVKVGSGINSMGYRYTVTGRAHIKLDRGTHWSWQQFIQGSRTGDTRTDFFMNRVRCTDGCKLHLSRSEWKFSGWLESIRSTCFQMFNNNTMSQMFWKDCTIGDFHEILTGATGVNQIRMRNCTFVGIYDDGFQTRHDISRVELGYCYYFNSAWGGFGEGGVAEGDDPNPGGWFVHHNILDNRQERGTNWRAQPHPHFLYGTHSADSDTPKKIYNNLFIWGPDSEEELMAGFQHCPQGANVANTNNGLLGASNMHQFFNNIALRVFLEGTKRYDAVSSLGGKYSDNQKDRSDFLTRFSTYSADNTNQLFDYNLYWRSSGLSVDKLLREMSRGGGTSATSYTLAEWLASAEFTHSKASGAFRAAYSAGFEGNSTDTKPTMPSLDDFLSSRFDYRPSAESQVTTAASSSLSGEDWWTTPPTWGDTYFPWNDGALTLAPDAWKGALDPSDSTMPIGVQNP